LYEQKKSAVSPIGCLFLKAGRVTFEAIELMVHEQIRQSVKEFATWQKLRIGFVEKEITPYDSIHLPVNEFILPQTIDAARDFLSMNIPAQDKTPSASAPV
jgi:hypothetical protein